MVVNQITKVATTLEAFVCNLLNDVEVEFRSPPHGWVRVDVVVRQCPMQGYYLMWNLLQLGKVWELSAHKGMVGKWAQHGWERWCAYLSEEVGLHEAHAQRKTMVRDMSLVGEAASSSEGLVADFRCMSTHALVAMLSRWASESFHFHMKGDADRDTVRGCLQSWCAKAFGNSNG